ncbi:MAG: glycosyltransferase family 4 protein [Candidatus Poribacteria bacterium]|nr:glycosyltransferase family 4 protein [Candidatus Poribacteria bacterium]
MFNYEFPPVGGGGGWVSHFLGKHFVAAGHEVLLITAQFRALPRDEVIEGFRVHRVPARRKRKDVCQVHEMLTYAISSSVYSFGVIKRFQPEIVQVFFGIPSGGGAYLLKKTLGLPYVVFLGGRDVPRPNPDPPYYRWLYRFLAPAIRGIWRNAAAVVACSDGLRDLALRTDSQAKLRVIPDGLDLSRFTPIPREAHPPRVRILTIGRLIPRKGFQFLIRAVPRVIQEATNDFEIELVGDGPERANLVKLADELGVRHKIHFAGSVPYSELPKKYKEADVFTLCSLAEGMPLVVLEAMGSGLPIVASRVQGIEDLEAVGTNGALFTPGDADALAQGLIEMINSGKRRVQMGRASVARVQKYDWKNIAESYLDIYREVMDKTQI